ncbi:MAG: type II toxin-antitoxin system PemK/MazF family toxin [Cyanobacteriota bacterium]|nr:type II toxin-antitoxin system PemK/MazF family toxin [Cyanobacteriota bacterium]
MPLVKGDIVLVPFPFTNLSQTKIRPAVVLWVDPQGQDITLCFISSQNLDRITSDELILARDDPEFTQTGLKVTSKIRATRIVTLERRLLQRRLGRLGQQQLQRLNEVLKFTLQIN